MKINGIKIWYDTEIHPDKVENPTYDALTKLPFFDESYDDGEHLLVAFWITDLTAIPTLERNLREVLEVLL